MSYHVIVTPMVGDKILEYGRYIAEQSGSLKVAEKWIGRIYAAIDALDVFPRRFNLAEEDEHRDYEIRCKVIGNYLVLYTIDDTKQTVTVIGFRHGHRLPRPEELPEDRP
jgi:mRNA-degrading endonuclease RelE of RelBE toxin-antitoxin system